MLRVRLEWLLPADNDRGEYKCGHDVGQVPRFLRAEETLSRLIP